VANPIKGYYFFLYQNGGCTVASDTILYQTTGLLDLQQPSSTIIISPNPNLGLFTVEFSTPVLPQTTLRISDGAGRILIEKQMATNSRKQIIEAQTLQSGVYFVQVIVEGKIIAIEKFVKQ
jgi:Secretion system C-terminal sorting domain